MRVLITGATGFTGGHLARTLASRGYAVRALVRNENSSRKLLRAGVEIAVGDLRDHAAVRRAVDNREIVYHIGAVYRQAGLSADEYVDVNAKSVGTVIEAAASAGVSRVVHCSTVGVHGDVEHPPADEDAPLRPGDIYQETKLKGEQIARDVGQREGIEVTIVRPTGIYGPDDRRLLKLFRGVASRRFVVLGSGKIFYHLTYIDDLVEGFRLCGEVPEAANRTYILAGDEVTTLNELINLIAEEAGVRPPQLRLPVWPFWFTGLICEVICAPMRLEPPLYRRRVDFFTKSRAFDISRARNEFGYTPRVSLRNGIKKTLRWYKEAGWI